ncbi:MAG: tetratricopeptide repeat protein [Planctomycetes bacterium]|nr:tetratricopeptide repeat protein [Planctomycetota bacterium]
MIRKHRFFSKELYPIIVLLLVSFITYLNALLNDFVFDDIYTISGNYFIRDWKNIFSLFTRNYFQSSGELSYRPIVTLTYFTDYSIWHLNPLGYHLTNIFLHTINTIILYFLLVCIIQKRSVSFISGLLFSCHPILSEAVNSASYREDLLSATFFFAAFILYIKFLNYRKSYLHIFSVVSYFFALFSKEMAITLPLILFFYYWLLYRKQTFSISILRHYIGYCFVAIFYFTTRFWWFHNPAESSVIYPDNSVWVNFLTMSKVFASYIRLFFFPTHLNADYIVPAGSGLHDTAACFSIIFIGVFFFIGYKLYSRSHLLFFSLIWFVISLIPVLNIVPVFNIMAERYLYIPSVGIFIAGGFLIKKISSIGFYFRRFHIVLASILLAGYFLQTSSRSRDWRNEFTCWKKIAEREPNSHRAHSSLGVLLIKNGFEKEGISELQKSLLINPLYADAHNNMGTYYQLKGMYENAVSEYQEALNVKQDFSEAHFNLGVIYSNLNKYDKAANEFLLSLSSTSDNPVILYNLATAYMKTGKHTEAIDAFRKSIKGNPLNADAYANTGTVLTKEGKLDDAIVEYKKALQIDPTHVDAHNNLGFVYINRKQYKDAISEFNKALNKQPENINILTNLGNACFLQGLWNESITVYEKILTLQADNATIYYQLANAYSKTGNNEKALEILKKGRPLSKNPTQINEFNHLINDIIVP